MTPETVIQLAQETLRVTAYLVAPMLLTALIVGLTISVLQAATQVQEMTLSFIPKLASVVIVLMVAGVWMLQVLIDFTQRLYLNIPALIG